MILEECKRVVKEKKISYYIIDDMNISSNNSDREYSDEGNNEQVRCADKYKKLEKTYLFCA